MSDDLVKSMEDDLRIGCSASIGDTRKELFTLAVVTIKAQTARIEELEGKMRQILEWHPTITTAPRRRISEIREIAKSALTGGKKDE